MALHADHIPLGDGTYVSKAALEEIRLVGPRSKWYDARLLEEALASPLRIWKDLKREGFEEGRCHVCRPSIRYDGNGKKQSALPQRLFLIFTKPSIHGVVAFDWEWRPGNESNGHLYDDENNFGELEWQKT